MGLLTGIAIRKVSHSKIKEVDFDQLVFRKHIADHMLVCDYNNGDPITPDGYRDG